jgi:hypothetical protein
MPLEDARLQTVLKDTQFAFPQYYAFEAFFNA